MKRIVITALLALMAFTSWSQQDPNTISVTGVYHYEVKPEYTARMIVSLQNIYSDYQPSTMSELKQTYMDKLKAAGINTSKLTENSLAYSLIGYEKAGTMLEFKTTSLKEMEQFLNVKSPGLSKSDASQIIELSDTQIGDYSKGAFDDAKKKATVIANKIGRKVGKVISINDNNYRKSTESLYYSNRLTNKEYYISVSFELE